MAKKIKVHHHRRRHHGRGHGGYGWQPPWWARQDDDDDDDDDNEYEFEGEDVELPRTGQWVRHGDKIVLLGV
jgi:hypothetical protein